MLLVLDDNSTLLRAVFTESMRISFYRQLVRIELLLCLHFYTLMHTYMQLADIDTDTPFRIDAVHINCNSKMLAKRSWYCCFSLAVNPNESLHLASNRLCARLGNACSHAHPHIRSGVHACLLLFYYLHGQQAADAFHILYICTFRVSLKIIAALNNKGKHDRIELTERYCIYIEIVDFDN